jgi:hypothetical protein
MTSRGVTVKEDGDERKRRKEMGRERDKDGA